MATKQRKPSSAQRSKSIEKKSSPNDVSQASIAAWRVSARLVSVISIAVMVILAGIIYWASQGGNQSTQTSTPGTVLPISAVQPETEEAPSVEISGSEPVKEPHVLPPTGSQPGNTAPEFSLVSLDNEEITLSDFRGEPVFVSFFHTW